MVKTNQQPKFGLVQLIRLLVFVIIFITLVNYLSSNQAKPLAKVNITPIVQLSLNIINQFIPASLVDKINQIPQTPLVLGVSQQLDDFPQKQIGQLKKMMADYIYQAIINNQ